MLVRGVGVLVLVMVACASTAPPPPVMRSTPVDRLARAPIAPRRDPSPPPARLPHSFVPATYHARLTVDPDQRELAGEIAIDGNITAQVTSLCLHGSGLRILSAELTGGRRTQRLEVSYVGDDLLELRAATAIEPGPHRLAIT